MTKTTYVFDKERGELVPIERTKPEPKVVLRKDAFAGVTGEGARCYQIERGHPAVAAAGVPTDQKGRAIVTSAAQRDALIDAYNSHEESRSGRKLVWTREAEDDE
jgi:hypothetical protein